LTDAARPSRSWKIETRLGTKAADELDPLAILDRRVEADPDVPGHPG